MKKALLILFAVVMVISLSSCEQIFDTIKGLFGGGDDEEQVDGPAPRPADEYENDDNADYAYGDHLNLITRHTFHSPTDEDFHLRPRISWDINDHWTWTLGADVFAGAHDFTQFGMLRNDNNIYTRLRFSF